MYNNKKAIICNWHTDSDGMITSQNIKNEQHNLVDNKVILNEIPDKNVGVSIDGMIEVYDYEDISENAYYVDYYNGIIHFGNTKKTTVTIANYNGLGLIYFPASRVWIEKNNIGTVTRTLDSVVDTMNNLDSIKDTIMKNIKEAKKDNADIIKNNTESKELVQKLSKILIDANSSEFTNKMSKSEELISQLSNGVALADSSKQNLQQVIENVQEKTKETNKVFEKLSNENNTANNNFNKLNNITTQIESYVDKANNFKETSATLKSFIDKVTDIKNQVTDIKNQIETQNTTSKANITDLKSLNEKSESTIEDLVSIQSEAIYLVPTLRDFKQTLSEMLAQKVPIENLNTSLLDYKNTFESLKTNIENANKELKSNIEKADLSQYITNSILDNALDNVLLTMGTIGNDLIESNKK